MLYSGVQIYESAAAVSKPSGKPHCDDTREMIEHFERLGLIHDVPAALQVHGKIYMHPVLYTKFKRMVPDMTNAFTRPFPW